jgi:hypothetical protein
MPATLSLPTNMRATHHRCCANCALRLPAPTLCARLVEPDGTLSTAKAAERARDMMSRLGPENVRCEGWRYPRAVAPRWEAMRRAANKDQKQ